MPPHDATSETSRPIEPALGIEPEPSPRASVEAKPTAGMSEPAVSDPWAGMAVDANELLSRMHAGHGWDAQDVIRRALAERVAA